MNPASPQFALQLASFDWEALLPLAFFVIYILTQVLGKKKPDAEEGGDEQDADAARRAEQIREEIRRRIQQQFGGGDAAPESSDGRMQPQSATRYDPTQPESRQRSALDSASAAQSTPRKEPSVPRSDPQPWAAATPDPTAGDTTQTLLQRLQEQRARLAAAREEQQAAKKRAESMLQARPTPRKVAAKPAQQASLRPVPGLSLRGSVRAGLASPQALRQAILYREILGPPVSQQQSRM